MVSVKKKGSGVSVDCTIAVNKFQQNLGHIMLDKIDDRNYIQACKYVILHS